MSFRDFQARIAGFALAILLGIAGASGAIQAANHHVNQQKVDVSQAEARFWRTVAGEESTAAPTVENQFAQDLQARLDSPEDLRAFRGDSNRYGGVSDAIGYDPFADESLECSECGALDAKTLKNLELIRQGKVDQVVDATVVTADTQGFTTTPFEMPLLPATGVVYLLGGTAVYYVARGLGKNKTFSDDKKPIPALSPIPWAIEHSVASAKTREVSRRTARKFPDAMATITDVDKTLASMRPSSMRDEVRAQRNAVVTELQHQSENKDDDDTKLQGLVDNLRGVQDYLAAREDAMGQLHEIEELQQAERPQQKGGAP